MMKTRKTKILSCVFEVPPSLVTGLGSLWSWRQVPQGSKAGAVPKNCFFGFLRFFCDTSRNISFYCVSWGHAKHHFLSSEKSHNTISLLPVRKHPEKLAQSAIAFWAQNTNAPPLKTRFFTMLILGIFRNFSFITMIKCPLIYRDILKKISPTQMFQRWSFSSKKTKARCKIGVDENAKKTWN